MKRIFTLGLLTAVALLSMGWGFFAHQKINRIAVFSLPPEMIGFYKANIRYITEKAVNPDKRRYVMKSEAPRHYIDLDVYGDSALYTMPRYWMEAVELYTEDTLLAYGIVPWHIQRVQYRLTEAFRTKDMERILRYSADLGHYIADAHVPLHTTQNYNGQLTGQYGIHGFWESRLPELFFDDYNLYVGQADYIENTQLAAWEAVKSAHLALDSVFQMERNITDDFEKDRKYSFEDRGTTTVRVYAFPFSRAYHQSLSGMVERQMRRSIKMTADFWYTAWVNAGQPKLVSDIAEEADSVAAIQKTENQLFRNHEAGEVLAD